MQKIILFFRKHYRKFLSFGVIVLLFVGVYTYFTTPYYKLSTYIMRNFGPIEHRELTITEDTFDGINYYYQIENKENTDFKILQLTDLHIGGSRASYSKDVKAFQAMYQLIEYTKPDLIVLTGDMLFVSLASRNINNLSAAVDLKSFFHNIGIPWMLVLGNHDSEFYNMYDDDELRTIFSIGENTSLLSPKFIGKKKSYSNQAIMLMNGTNEINTALLFMDSNELVDETENAIEWYSQTIDQINQKYQKNVPSMLFMHYPLYEYEEAYDLYKKGDPTVTYQYGEKREDVCYEKKTNFFDTIVEKNSTKSIFVGHDHLNDYSLEYKGIRLTYGKSIDYITYGGIEKKTEQRGGTLITIKEDSSFLVQPIKLQDIL